MRLVRSALVAATCVGLTACGGGSVEEGGDSPDGGATVPSIAFLGDLVVMRGEPLAATFDAAGGSLELGGGAVVEIPEGAFPEATELTVVVADLDYAQYLENPPSGVAYVLSTSEEVELGSPVVLEVPVPPEDVMVMQPVAGEWVVVDVAAGPTTRALITHFSEVPTVVFEQGAVAPGRIGSDPEGDVPGDFFLTCFLVTELLLSGGLSEVAKHDRYSLTDDDLSTLELSQQLASLMCTRALVSRYSPLGVRVEVGCVGEKISALDGFEGRGGDALRAAINACVADYSPTAAPASGDPTADGSDAIGRLDGTYTGTFTEGVADFTLYEQWMDVTATFEPVVVTISGGSWTLSAGWTTITPACPSQDCALTEAVVVTGSGVIEDPEGESGGPYLMGGSTMEKTMTGCSHGCSEISQTITDPASNDLMLVWSDGVLEGRVRTHEVVLERN